MKSSLLITGGNGDLSIKLAEIFSGQYTVYSPCRNELDVSDPLAVEEYFSDITFDVVINCAGTLYSSLIENSDPELWIRDINSSLIGSYLVSRAVVKGNAKATIINVASTAAFASYKDWSSYCCAKAGVLTLSKSLFNGGYDAYCLCPGAIDTKIRNGLTISNNNVMTLEEAAQPFIDVLKGKYNSGDVIFYRKDSLVVNPE